MTEVKTGKAPAAPFEVQQMDFPATSFAIIRQVVKWPDITAFFAQHLPILYEDAAKNNINAGAATGLYYVWDEKNQQADMAVAVPVPAGTKLPHSIIRFTAVDASKAVYVNYSGAYDKLADAHRSLDMYLAANKLTPKQPVMEQYIYGPVNEKDTTKWLTKIVYLVE
jgi:effector-binding domain-containing protein